jgi:hypothetical protein
VIREPINQVAVIAAPDSLRCAPADRVSVLVGLALLWLVSYFVPRQISAFRFALCTHCISGAAPLIAEGA